MNNKCSPGTRPGEGGKSTKPGVMPSKKAGASGGSNHKQADNGCWHSGSTGSGTKARP